MQTEITVIGADRLAATLRRAADDLRDLSAANRDAADRVAASTRARSRRKTGRLASSFSVTVTADTADVSSGVEYALVQEFGSNRHNIRPSYALTGSLRDNVPAISDIYLKAVTETIGRVKGK